MPHLKPESSCCAQDGAAQVDALSFAATGWLFLGRARTLCLPRVNKEQHATLDYSLRFFMQPGWRRWIYRICLMPGLRRLCLLPDGNQNGDAFGRLFGSDWPGWQRLPGNPSPYLAARYGSPGPYQKLSVLFVDAVGKGLAFVKVALSPQANRMVQREQGWLDRLAAIPELQGSVPAVLQAGQTGNAQAYLMSTVAPDLGRSGPFDEPHARFLSVLGQHTVQPAQFGDSMEATFIADALARLAEVLGEALHAELERAWSDAARTLKGWHGPLVLAHRDFVPWNMCRREDQLFVFDWEYAADRASPLHDFFHYHLMPVAASRWRRVRADRLRSLIGQAADFARSHYPDSQWDDAVVSAWLLVYLLDVVLFYTDSNQRFNPRRPVLAAYTDMIRNRNRWRVY